MFYFTSQTGPGCDESQVHQIPYGTTKKMMKGALYQFNCDEGAVLSGSPTIFCDGKSWNDTAPTCLSKFFFIIIEKNMFIISSFWRYDVILQNGSKTR